MAEMLVVRSKIKDFCKDCNVSGDFAGALSAKVEELVTSATERAKANGRKTVQARDL
jgi:histone H3/H4